jgi:hypothetical protein
MATMSEDFGLPIAPDHPQAQDHLSPQLRLRVALEQLLDEVVAAGFESATDRNWPKAIADAKAALGRTD